MRVLIAGCGYVGTALARELAASAHEPIGLRRSAATIDGVRMIAADLLGENLVDVLPRDVDAVVYAVSAGGGDESSYRAAYVTGLERLLVALRAHGEHPRRLLFVSSTGVYGQLDGEWVDETSPTEPSHFSGRILLEGERLTLASGWPATVLRLGGIYGPMRTRVIDGVRRGEASCSDGPPIWTNRIHRDDAARAIAHLLGRDGVEEIYVGVDREPADQCDVFRWLAGELGVPPPVKAPGPTRDRRYERSNKRCRSERLVASGFRFRYPTYREGYASLIGGSGPGTD